MAVIAASLPLSVGAVGTIFEAELVGPVVERTGSMSEVADTDACGNAALEAPSTPNAVSYTISFQQSGVRYLWLRVLQPPSTTRSILMTLDGGSPPSFSVPQESFDLDRGAVTGYTWERVTLRGSGSPGSPEEDPRVVSITAGNHDIDLGIQDADVRIDRVGVTTRIDFVPNNCDAYSDPTNADGGGSQDGGSQDGGGNGGDSGGPPSGDSGRIDGVIVAGCEPGDYFDLVDAACRKPGEVARCVAAPTPLWGGLVWMAYRRRHRSRRRR